MMCSSSRIFCSWAAFSAINEIWSEAYFSYNSFFFLAYFSAMRNTSSPVFSAASISLSRWSSNCCSFKSSSSLEPFFTTVRAFSISFFSRSELYLMEYSSRARCISLARFFRVAISSLLYPLTAAIFFEYSIPIRASSFSNPSSIRESSDSW